MKRDFKKLCLIQNQKLVSMGLVFETFGNVSQRIDSDHFTIKPSGVDLTKIKKDDFPVINIENGKVIGSTKFKPSSDTPTHQYLYKKFPEIGGISHTHSVYATAWSQSNKPIPILGTTHADYSNIEIPITKILKPKEINNNYELNTAISIYKRLKIGKMSINKIPGILINNHGPISWGIDSIEAVNRSNIIEFLAKLAFKTLLINPKSKISRSLIAKHFERKNGKNRYYGQIK